MPCNHSQISLVLLLLLASMSTSTGELEALRIELKEHAERQQQEGERCGMPCSLTLLTPGTLEMGHHRTRER